MGNSLQEWRKYWIFRVFRMIRTFPSWQWTSSRHNCTKMYENRFPQQKIMRGVRMTNMIGRVWQIFSCLPSRLVVDDEFPFENGRRRSTGRWKLPFCWRKTTRTWTRFDWCAIIWLFIQWVRFTRHLNRVGRGLWQGGWRWFRLRSMAVGWTSRRTSFRRCRFNVWGTVVLVRLRSYRRSLRRGRNNVTQNKKAFIGTSPSKKPGLNCIRSILKLNIDKTLVLTQH